MKKYEILVNNAEYGIAFAGLGEFKDKIVKLEKLDRNHKLLTVELSDEDKMALKRLYNLNIDFLVKRAERLKNNEIN